MRAVALCFLLAPAIVACASSGSSPPPPSTNVAASESCHPSIDASRPQFVVGYGSLMEDESRARTSPRAGAAHPVDVQGYERGWFEHGSPIGFSTTFLGVRPEPAARMNAVIYAIEARELAATDSRERSYCRSLVPPASLKELDARFALPRDAQAWIYVTDAHRIAMADARYPIVQSYVDVFLSGCFEQEERYSVKDFARECVATTKGWSAHWVNDRIYPRRPFVHQPRAGEIDALLAATIPREFASIRLDAGATAAPR